MSSSRSSDATPPRKAFRERYTPAEQSAEAARVRARYPERVPVIVEVRPGDPIEERGGTELKEKYLVPGELTVGQFVATLRKRIALRKEEAIFVFVQGSVLPATAALLSDLDREHRDETGFLFMTVTSESTFGADA